MITSCIGMHHMETPQLLLNLARINSQWEAEEKHVEELATYIITLLEELSQPASLEFQYDDRTASYLRTIIKDSKTKVS